MIESYIKIENNIIWYKVIGKGEPILFIHGGPGLTHNYFLPYFKDLANEGYMLIFYDQLGNGKSYTEELEGNITLSNFTEHIELLRKELNIDKLNIFSHSMGGYFAIDYAVKYRENVKSIILCNTVPFKKEHLEEMNENLNFRFMNIFGDICELQNSNEFRKSEPKAFKEYLTLINKCNFYDENLSSKLFKSIEIDSKFMVNFQNINQMLLKEYDLLIEKISLTDVCMPTLLIGSDFDFIPSVSNEYIERKIKNSKLRTIEECGHYTFVEKSEEVYNLVLEFLQDMINK